MVRIYHKRHESDMHLPQLSLITEIGARTLKIATAKEVTTSYITHHSSSLAIWLVLLNSFVVNWYKSHVPILGKIKEVCVPTVHTMPA